MVKEHPLQTFEELYNLMCADDKKLELISQIETFDGILNLFINKHDDVSLTIEDLLNIRKYSHNGYLSIRFDEGETDTIIVSIPIRAGKKEMTDQDGRK